MELKATARVPVSSPGGMLFLTHYKILNNKSLSPELSQ